MAAISKGGGREVDPGVKVTDLINANPAYVRERMDGIAELAEWINAIGMINPIITTPDYLIIDGARRLEAARLLRWKTVPVIATDNWDTILERMIEARNPVGSSGLVPLPMSYLETSDLIHRIMRPIEMTDRARGAALTRKGKRSKAPTGRRDERIQAFGAALGLSMTDMHGISAMTTVIRKAEQKEAGAGKRYADYIREAEAMGLRPQTIVGHLHEYGGPPKRMLEQSCPPKKEQAAVIEATITILRVLGSDLRSKFPTVSPDFTIEEVQKLERDLYNSTQKLRQVGSIMRRHVTEKKETK